LCPTYALCLNVRVGDYYTAAIHTKERESSHPALFKRLKEKPFISPQEEEKQGVY